MSVTDTMTARNANLSDLHAMLEAQQSAKLDVVVPARDLTVVGGNVQVLGAGEPVLTPDGVSLGQVSLRPTSHADANLAAKLDIPIKYVRRLRDQHIGLYDESLNTLLGEDPDYRFLVRGLVDAGTDSGVGRAFLSSSYRVTDNLDVLITVLEGIRAAGVPVQITQCDLSETKMYVAVKCDAVSAYAPSLLANYTSPFSGARGAENPLVFAGFVVSNSETGHGRTSITPRLTVQVCDNGMTIDKDALAATHLGAKMADGVIRWGADTKAAELSLITKQTRDAVTTFLDVDYVTAKLAQINRDAGVAISNPGATLEHVGQELRFSALQRQTVLSHFIDGGDRTSGGVLHAVTSAAQLIQDPDTAWEMERAGLKAMTLAAAHASR